MLYEEMPYSPNMGLVAGQVCVSDMLEENPASIPVRDKIDYEEGLNRLLAMLT